MYLEQLYQEICKIDPEIRKNTKVCVKNFVFVIEPGGEPQSEVEYDEVQSIEEIRKGHHNDDFGNEVFGSFIGLKY